MPQGTVLRLAYGAVRGVLSDPTTRRVFAIFGVAYLASQMSRPYLPVVVEVLNTDGQRLTSDIALVAGTAALAGALVSPLGGWLGDRIGFRPVLTAALLGAGMALVITPLVPSIPLLAVIALLYTALSAAVSAMVFGLLALEIPAERRSTTLNLVSLPLYAAGVVGPTAGAIVVSLGLGAPFIAGGAILLAGGVLMILRRPGNGPGTGAGQAAGRSRSRAPT